jgi:feruloyl esterase
MIKSISRSFYLGALWGVMVVLLVPTEIQARDLPVVKAAVSCESLATAVFAATGEAPARVNSATLVSIGTPSPYCNVRGYVAPQVNFELHLPTENWTQRLLYSGCGGFCGQVNVRTQAAERCQPVQDGELALVAADLGHSTSALDDAMWSVDNPQGRVNFGYRGVHAVVVAAKQIVARFYGRAQQFAYFSGCSDGGREGLNSLQRYPGDFNGVIAGAPVVNLTANNSLYHAWIVRQLLRPDGTKRFSDANLVLLHQAVVSACALGGQQIGEVIADPRDCHFDPAKLLCVNSTVNCLTAEQVKAVRELYAGAHDADGRALYFGLPHGSELVWNTQAPSSLLYATSFIGFLAGDPAEYPVNVWSVTFSQESLQHYSRSGDILNALNPDLRPFAKKGGKVLIWHGWADVGVPPMSSIAYVDSVRANAGAKAANDFLRLYMLPGVYHCGGGPGPDRIDLLTPLMTWVEDGVAPQSIIASTRVYGRLVRTTQMEPDVSRP